MINSHFFAGLSLWMETPCFIISLNLFLHSNKSLKRSKRRKKSPWQKGKSVRPLLVWAAREKSKPFDRPLQTRQLREKLMAMINDKGPEESGDTAATYIIPPHQSEHLPGPSLSHCLPRSLSLCLISAHSLAHSALPLSPRLKSRKTSDKGLIRWTRKWRVK